jgi:hypothetical protein
MAYFYFDFRDINKQHWRDLVPSLLIQLSAQSGPRGDILSHLHSNHDSGARQPNDDILTRCLKDMLMLPNQRPIYLIFDALDECSNVSNASQTGSSACERARRPSCTKPSYMCRKSPSSRYTRCPQASDLSPGVSTIRADKRKTSRTMLGPLLTRTRSQSCGDGGRRIRNSSLRRSLNGLTECM